MRTFFIPLIAMSLASVPLHAADAPPIEITVKSYQALERGAATLINAVAPGQADALLAEFREEMGLDEMEGVDRSRPWQAVIWLESASQDPSVSIRVPVSDFDAFKAGFDISELVDDEEESDGSHSVSRVGDYAVVWIEEAGTSAAVKEANASWKPADLGAVDHLFRVAFRPAEPLRNELLGLIGMGRMMVSGALSEQPEDAMPGIDMKALLQMLGLYFDVVETGIRGVGELSAGLNVDGEALVLDESILPQPGSELANWLQGGGASLEGMLTHLDAGAQGEFALRFGDTDAVKPLLKRYLGLSFQMMGTDSQDPVVADTEKLIDAMLPMQFGGVLNFDKGLKFGGVYRFPGRDLEQTYGLFSKFMSESMQPLVGEDKPYSEITFKEGVREVAGEQVDQVTMKINLDAPMYQQPGQKDMVDLIWGGDSIVFDYATKGDGLFVGTGETFDRVIRGDNSAGTPVLPVDANTVAYGRLNLLRLIPSVLSGHPMMPPEMKEQIAGLDTAGTDVAIRINLDKGMHSRTRVPLKLISTVAQFAAGTQGGE